MPFVNVNLLNGRSTEEKDAIATSIQAALVRTLDVSDANRYQLFNELDGESFRHTPGYLGMTYSDQFLVIEITIRQGDGDEKKRSLLAEINRNLVAAGVVGADDAFVLITEIGDADVSFGRGLAQRTPSSHAAGRTRVHLSTHTGRKYSMPLVKVNLLKGRSAAEKDSIATSIQAALVSTLGIPDEDRFQVFNEYDDENFRHTRGYLGMAYTDQLLIIEITFLVGRDDEVKKSLLAEINRNLVAAGVVGADDTFVLITEIGRANVSFGRGLAHRAPSVQGAE